MGVPPPIACQPIYNAMTRGIETELLPCCAHYGIGVVVYSPLARGVLTAKYRAGEAPEPGSRAARADRRLMQSEYREESLRLSQTLSRRTPRRASLPPEAGFAIAWALNNRLVAGVIGGPRTLAQWQDYLAGAHVRVTAEDETFVDGLAWCRAATPPPPATPILYPVTGRVPRIQRN